MARELNPNSGGTGWVVAVVATSTLMVIFMITTVVLYLYIEDYRTQAEQAQGDLRRIATPSQISSDPVQALRGNAAGGTVVEQLLNQRQALTEMIVGDPTATLDALQQRKQRIDQRTGRDGALIGQVDAIQQALTGTQRNVQDLTNRLEQATDRARRAEEQLAVRDRQYNQAVAELRDRVSTQASSYGQTTSRYETRLTELNGRLGEVRSSTAERVRELQTQLAQANVRVRQLDSELKLLQKIKQTSTGGNVINADGEITTVNVGTDIVFINRGRLDNIFAGMTFEVFEHVDVIKTDEFDELRGKATIEVFDVGDRTARARVVRRMHGEIVDEGDVIVNLIYDPDTVFTFHVYGRFDLDLNGNPTEADERKVQAMVERFGGRVSPELDYNVDFLVLGIAPELPQPLSPTETDTVAIETYARTKRAYDNYQDLIDQALELNIPVLNQNRFLALIGYYER